MTRTSRSSRHAEADLVYGMASCYVFRCSVNIVNSSAAETLNTYKRIFTFDFDHSKHQGQSRTRLDGEHLKNDDTVGANTAITNSESRMRQFDLHTYSWPRPSLKVKVEVIHIPTVNISQTTTDRANIETADSWEVARDLSVCILEFWPWPILKVKLVVGTVFRQIFWPSRTCFVGRR